MINNSFYFKHDNNAASDDKMLALIAEYDWQGYGIFWAILEAMSRNEGGLKASLLGGLALGLRLDKKWLVKFLDFCVDIGVFTLEDNTYISSRMVEQLEYRKMLSESGKKGAEIKKERGATRGAVSQNEGGLQAGEERIVEDRTEKDSKEIISAHALPQIKQEFLNLAELQIKGVAFSNPAFQKKWEVGNGEFSNSLNGLCQKWAKDIEKLHRIDKASCDDIEQVIRWLYSGKTEDSIFWRKNIMSGDKLRKQYQKLVGSALSEIQTKRGGLNLDEI